MKKDELHTYLVAYCRGQERVIGSRQLARAIRVSENELRKQVNRLRCDEKPIASCRYGYYYAENAGELYDTIQSLKKMRSGIDAAISGLEKALKQFPIGVERI